MARCETCTTPCNCYIDEDGYWSERPQDGRRNTVASGAGTLEDPLTISFMQSEFYQPSAGEIRGSFSSPGGWSIITHENYDISIYQTPERVMIPAPVGFNIHVTFGTWFIVGASVTFAANSIGAREIWIVTDDPILLFSEAIAGNIQSGLAARNTILSCSGFVPGYLLKSSSIITGLVDIRSAPYVVEIVQTSGGPMNISNIKLWITTI